MSSPTICRKCKRMISFMCWRMEKSFKRTTEENSKRLTKGRSAEIGYQLSNSPTTWNNDLLRFQMSAPALPIHARSQPGTLDGITRWRYGPNTGEHPSKAYLSIARDSQLCSECQIPRFLLMSSLRNALLESPFRLSIRWSAMGGPPIQPEPYISKTLKRRRCNLCIAML